jgi:diguanylate cyclase (GGDEF)-like protein
MSQAGAPNPPRLSAEESFLDLLTDTLDSLERPARGQFLQRFFKSIASVDISETQSLDFWDQALARKREFSESLGKRVALQVALVDVLASAKLLRLPILMEYEELRKLQISAATDSLTGLYNRRFFDDYFEKELNRSIRYSHKLALIVFDLHRFKEVNDRHGHPRGDALLQLAASTLRNSLRTSDYAFRIGGDEFAILLPQSDTEQADVLSRRLRTAYAAFVEPLHLGVPVALDYGLAVYPEDGDLQQVLIRVADERLYQLKNNGDRSPAPPSASTRLSVARQQEPPTGKSAAEPPVASPIPSPISASVTSSGSASVSSSVSSPTASEDKTPGFERRRWERVSLANTHAYALIGEGVERTARVLDLGYGGIALQTSRPDEFDETFHAVLHVPILPPVRVSLRRVYRQGGDVGTGRIGCAFVT